MDEIKNYFMNYFANKNFYFDMIYIKEYNIFLFALVLEIVFMYNHYLI
jgi:hypothetical protein